MLVSIFGLAGLSVSSMNSNELPIVDLGVVQILTIYPGASPKDVEQNVTRLIEEELQRVDGVETYKSVSSENASNIQVEIDVDNPDPEKVKDDIRRAVDRVTDLPVEIKSRPQIQEIKSSERPVLIVGVAGDEKTKYGDLRRIAKVVEKDIKNIRGISKVVKYGFQDLEYHVDLNPEKLKQNYVALNDIIFALAERNIRATGGSLESYRTQRNILTISEFESIQDIREVIVRSSFGGGKLRIDDVADVSDSFEDESILTVLNGDRGIMLVVKKSESTDIITIVDKLKDYVKNKKAQLPPGITLSTANDLSKPVRNRINVVISNAVIGFFLVVLILIIFLDFRSSFMVALSIPSSFAITFPIMFSLGVDINALTLVGMIIALGMIVDQSIVVSENSLVYIRKGVSRFEAIKSATVEVAMPIIASVITTVLAFVPMLVMTGLTGKFVYVIPIVVIVSLVSSLVNCFVVLPNHLNHSLPEIEPPQEEEEKQICKRGWQDHLFEYIAKPYRLSLPMILRHRYITVSAAFLFLFFSFWWSSRFVPINMFPPDGAEEFYIYVEMEDDSTFNTTEELITKIEAVVKQIPKDELLYYTARIGTHVTDEQALVPIGGEEHLAYFQVSLRAHSKRDRDASIIMDEVRSQVSEKVKGVKGIRKLSFKLVEQGPPTGKAIEMRIHSDNDKLRKQFVDSIVTDLKNTNGIYDVSTDAKVGREEYKLDINYNLLGTTGLTVQNVASTLRIAFDGIVATSLVRENENIDVRVRFPLKHRQNVQNVLNLHVRNQQGNLIPIRSFAKLSRIRGDTAIYHTNGDVTTTITAQTKRTTQPQNVIDTMLKKYSSRLKEHPEVRFSYGGKAEENEKSIISLIQAFLAGLIAIYLVLTLLFNSFSQPAIVISAIPFGMIGIIWAFYFHDRPFSFLAMIGIIGLSGIVVNNSLMMVDFINKIFKRKTKKGTITVNALIPEVTIGATQRLRPILITTMTTVFGLLPTAYGLGGSDPLIEPMVLAIAWGLLFSTQISLFLVPVLYMLNLDATFALKKLWHGYIMILIKKLEIFSSHPNT